MTCFAVIGGGGTSGHVLPAIAIGEALVDTGNEISEIFYTGSQRGIETRLIPATGMGYKFFQVTGLQRSFSLAAWKSNLLFVPRMLRARHQAIRLLQSMTPKVVVSVGGYASLPAVLAAKKLGIPIVVVSYDRTPGRSSSLTARFAQKTAVAFPDSQLPRAVMTGAPVRRVVRCVDREHDRVAARQRLGIDEKRFFIGVIGGSQGSGMLNEITQQFVQRFADDDDLAVRHVVGPRFFDDFKNPVSSGQTRGVQYQVIAYEEHMEDMYASVDLLIGRAGAGTIADVAATGTPSILIPWAGATDDHQTANAAWLTDSGAAIALKEGEVAESLIAKIEELRGNRQLLVTVARHAHALGAQNRQGAIAELIRSVAQGAR